MIPLKSNKKLFSAEAENSKFTFSLTPVAVKVGDLSQIIGNVLLSVTAVHMYHLCTNKYARHIALNEYYDEMPDLVDALAEHILGSAPEFNISVSILPNECVIDYLDRLLGFITESEGTVPSAIQSLIDDILNLISSTLYKLKRLDSGCSAESKQFSKVDSDEEFRKYAHEVMKNAHGDKYSEEFTDKVVDDLLDEHTRASYGELIGRLTSGLGE